MARTHLITGSASGIGKATVERLRAAGHRVIGADLRNADIIADLSTAEGRALLVTEAERLAPEGLDGVLAGAGMSSYTHPDKTLALNYFGAVATLEGLRPLLGKSDRPRAAAIISTTCLLPASPAVLDACLAGDEPRALAAVQAPDAGGGYVNSKHALARWLRREAGAPNWAGAGILLNGIAPGVVETAMTAPVLANAEGRAQLAQHSPQVVEGFAKPEEMAEVIDFLLNFQNHYMLGQILFVDGGADVMARPDSH